VDEDAQGKYICACVEVYEDNNSDWRYTAGEKLKAQVYTATQEPDDDAPSSAVEAEIDKNGEAHFDKIRGAAFGECELYVWTTVAPIIRRACPFVGDSPANSPNPSCDLACADPDHPTMRPMSALRRGFSATASATIKSLVQPVIWNLERFGDFRGADLTKFNRNLALRIEKVDIHYPTHPKDRAAWRSRDNVTPKPSLRCESLRPVMYRLSFRRAENGGLIEYVCVASDWDPLGTNKLGPNPGNQINLAGGEYIPIHFKAIPTL